MGNTLSAQIENASKTGVLSLRGSGIDEMPEKVFALAKLRSLDVSSNKIKRLGEGVSKLTSLVNLNVDDNAIAGFHPSTHLSEKLENISCNRNRFETLPAQIFASAKLKKILFAGNRIAAVFGTLPATVDSSIRSGVFASLTLVDLSDNRISVIENHFVFFPHLEELNLSNNSVSLVPDFLANSSLKILRLKNNKIADRNALSAQVLRESKIDLLELDGNPFLVGADGVQRNLADVYDDYVFYQQRHQMRLNKQIAGGVI